jgi:hypothetical protein
VSLSSKASIIGKVRELIKSSSSQFRALKFVLLIGVMSFFADFVYEGSRGIIGPYLALLGASAFTVSAVTGFGAFIGYAWRLISGSLSDKTGQFWFITIFGYVIQMASVPLLALVESWQMATVLIILERFGRATRNPPRDVMLSYAAKEMGGYGWSLASMKHLTNSEHYWVLWLQPVSLLGVVTTGSLLPCYSFQLSSCSLS